MSEHDDSNRGGLFHAIGAYMFWGVFPLYLVLIDHVPPLEFVGWRVTLTLPICLVIVLARRQVGQLLAALKNPGVLTRLAASSIFIACNWLVYVSAILGGHFYAASLGYYINPLVNVLLGTIFLGERLTRRQWLAVAIAAAGVAVLSWGARDMLWISLTIAFSFAAYGLLRKLAPIGSVPGLAIESTILVLPAAGIIAWYAGGPSGQSFGHGLPEDFLLACAGLVTAIPLLLFAIAARRLDFSALGFLQYITPTLVFLLGLIVFAEPLNLVQLACFVLIWTAIALFTYDVVVRRERVQPIS